MGRHRARPPAPRPTPDAELLVWGVVSAVAAVASLVVLDVDRWTAAAVGVLMVAVFTAVAYAVGAHRATTAPADDPRASDLRATGQPDATAEPDLPPDDPDHGAGTTEQEAWHHTVQSTWDDEPGEPWDTAVEHGWSDVAPDRECDGVDQGSWDATLHHGRVDASDSGWEDPSSGEPRAEGHPEAEASGGGHGHGGGGPGGGPVRRRDLRRRRSV